METKKSSLGKKKQNSIEVFELFNTLQSFN